LDDEFCSFRPVKTHLAVGGVGVKNLFLQTASNYFVAAGSEAFDKHIVFRKIFSLPSV
jgi:hypothetical protein